MKLLLQNRQTERRVRAQAVRALADWLIARWPTLGTLAAWSEIALIVVDDDGMTPINHATFGKNKPTDVISLTYHGLPGESLKAAGEIFINAERACAIGRTTAGANREFALYLAHGLHHLTGATDRTANLRRAMLNEETTWLAKAGKNGLLKELIHP